jgi:hypothetical protein
LFQYTRNTSSLVILTADYINTAVFCIPGPALDLALRTQQATEIFGGFC